MKISYYTTTILKQCASVAPGITINPGNVIATRTDDAVVEATISEMFAKEVRLPDIHEFLPVLALFNDPTWHFEGDCVRISESNGTAETVYALGKAGTIPQRSSRKKPIPAEHTIHWTRTVGDAAKSSGHQRCEGNRVSWAGVVGRERRTDGETLRSPALPYTEAPVRLRCPGHVKRV